MARLSLSDYIPATRAGKIFAFITFVNAVGLGLFLAASAIFYVRSVGLTEAQVGVALGIAAAGGFASTIPIGVVADRVGAQRTLIVLQLWRGAWFVVMAFTHEYVLFIVVATALAIAEAPTQPMTVAIAAATVEEEHRVRTMAIVNTVRNAGFSIGALLAAPLLAFESPWTSRSIMLGTAAAFLVGGVLLGRLRLPRRTVPERKVSPLVALGSVKDWRYLLLTGLNGVLFLHATVLPIGIPLWVLAATDVPSGFVPFLILVNTLLAIVLQVPVAKWAERPNGGAIALVFGGLGMAACSLVLALSNVLPRMFGLADCTLPPFGGISPTVLITGFILLIATVCLTGGELSQAVGAWELSYAHAPEDRRGTYLSVFSLGMTAQKVAGPPLIAMVVLAGPLGWAGMAVLFVLAAYFSTVVAHSLERATEARTASADAGRGPGAELDDSD